MADCCLDDSTISETILKNEISHIIKRGGGDIANQSRADKFQVNESKCKEMRISFSKMEMKRAENINDYMNDFRPRLKRLEISYHF